MALPPPQHLLVVKWDRTASSRLPTHIGPFDTIKEAEEYADLNVRLKGQRNTFEVQELHFPYARTMR